MLPRFGSATSSGPAYGLSRFIGKGEGAAFVALQGSIPTYSYPYFP